MLAIAIAIFAFALGILCLVVEFTSSAFICFFLSIGSVAAHSWGTKLAEEGKREKEQQGIDEAARRKEEAEKHEIARVKAELERKEKILLWYEDEWGVSLCNKVINREIVIGMTEEMIEESWGEPETIDREEINSRSHKIRWIYGIPRRDATYIYFTDGIVTDIKKTGDMTKSF